MILMMPERLADAKIVFDFVIHSPPFMTHFDVGRRLCAAS
jgi:hypothetical protein